MNDFGFMPNKMVGAHELLRSALGFEDTGVVKEKPDDIQNVDDTPPPCQHFPSSLMRSPN